MFSTYMLCLTIVYVFSLRSVHGRFRDFFPWAQFGWVPEQSTYGSAVQASANRNNGLDKLVALCEERFARGELNDCAMKIMLENEKTKLTRDETVSLSNSMVSAGVGE
jgi:hypothetical protein